MERITCGVAGLGAAGCGSVIFYDWFFGDLSNQIQTGQHHTFTGLCLIGGLCFLILVFMTFYKSRNGCEHMRYPAGGLALSGILFSVSALAMNAVDMCNNHIGVTEWSTQVYWLIGATAGLLVCGVALCFIYKKCNPNQINVHEANAAGGLSSNKSAVPTIVLYPM